MSLFADLERRFELDRDSLRPGQILTVAAGIGLLAGYAELGIVWFGAWRGNLDPGTYQPHLEITAPLAALGFFLILGALASVPLLPRAVRSGRVVVFVLAALAIFGWLSLVALSLHSVPTLIFAAGLASMLTRLVARRAGAVVTAGRWAAALGALALLLTIGARFVAAPMLERGAVRQLEDRGDQPNVLLIILDTVRARSLSLYGYDRPTTPRLERLGAEGAVFETAISSSSWTLPAHGTMFTGRWPHELSADWHSPLDDTYPTLAEALGEHGYATGAFIANKFFGARYYGLGRGFRRFDPGPLTLDGLLEGYSSTRRAAQIVRARLGHHSRVADFDARDVRDRFLGWSDGLDGAPYFAFLNMFDAHQPYSWPGRGEEGTPRYWYQEDGYSYSPEELAELRDAYDRAIEHIDRTLGELFDEMRARGDLENTIVIVTADHGEEFGEHDPRLVKHGYSLYSPSVHVPLLVYYPPGVPGGLRVSAPVAPRDLPATIAELVGLEGSGPFPGTSLLRFASTDSAGSHDALAEPVHSATNPDRWRLGPDYDFMPFSKGPMRSVVVDGMRHIRTGDGSEEFFDVARDPWEQLNLLTDAPSATRIDRARSEIQEALPPDR